MTVSYQPYPPLESPPLFQSDHKTLQSTHKHAEHRHNIARDRSPGRDLGILGVLVHVVCDALNNIGVIIAALVIWRTDYATRYYADPGASMGISLMIFASALPLVKSSGSILLQSAPCGVNASDVKHDLEKVKNTPYLSALQNRSRISLRGSLTCMFGY